MPTTKQRAYSATVKDDLRRRTKMLARLQAIASESDLVRFGVAEGVLLPVDDLTDWPAHRAPRTN